MSSYPLSRITRITILELFDFLSNRLQDTDAAGVRVNDHVYLEAVIFRAEQGLLVLSSEKAVTTIVPCGWSIIII